MKIVFEWPAEMSRGEWETEAARLDELFQCWLIAHGEQTFQLPPGVRMRFLNADDSEDAILGHAMETRPAPSAVAQELPFGPGMLDPSIVRSDAEALEAIHERIAETEDPRKSVWPVLERRK